MKFPSKITPYKESIISKFTVILDFLEKRDYELFSLYNELEKKMTITEFINALDCLYALNIIDLTEGVLHYVIQNAMW